MIREGQNATALESLRQSLREARASANAARAASQSLEDAVREARSDALRSRTTLRVRSRRLISRNAPSSVRRRLPTTPWPMRCGRYRTWRLVSSVSERRRRTRVRGVREQG